jgi:hypothetical protein
MNREQKRELVCRLYKEGKTMREISKQAHMSFSDIGSITKKLNEELESKTEDLTAESSRTGAIQGRKGSVRSCNFNKDIFTRC